MPASHVDPIPTHVSTGCDDFSTGAVHVLATVGGWASDVLLEITKTNASHAVCGSVGTKMRISPDQGMVKRIRQTDGALLYLLNGDIYQYVADPLDVGPAGATSPLQNDIKLSVKNSCPANRVEGAGPFAGFMLKPNGGIVFSCATHPAPYATEIYDEDGTVYKLINDLPPMLAVNDDGQILAITPVRGGRLGILDHGKGLPFYPEGSDVDCLEGSYPIAVRALKDRFWIVLQNRCGTQLWEMMQTSMRMLTHYYYAPTDAILADDPGHGEVTADGTLYFSELCQTNVSCVQCGGPICGLSIGNRTATIPPFTAYPLPGGVPGGVQLSHELLFDSWSPLGI